MISIDDFHVNNYQIAEMAVKNKIAGEVMFFMNFPTYEAEKMAIRLSDYGCQIGSHTINHKNLININPGEVRRELADSRKLIKSLTGKECSWLAYPFGAYNDEVIQIVKDTGYKYARVTHTFNFENPYEVSAMHIGRLKDEKCGCQNSYEFAKRTSFKHFYTHYIDLFKDKSNSFEQLDKFMEWYGQTLVR